MPSVNIWEKDLTSAGQNLFDNFNVLVPGLYSNLLWGKTPEDIESSGSEGTVVEPVIVSKNSANKSAISFSSFRDLILSTIPDTQKSAEQLLAKKAIEDSYGYKVTEKLVEELGMTVIYGVITKKVSGEIVPGSLSDLDNDYDSEGSYFKQFADRGLYDIRFITTSGYRTAKSAENAVRCASNRGDAIALIDIPDTYTEEPEQSGGIPTTYTLDTAENIYKYIESLEGISITRKIMGTSDTVTENGYSYAASFAPDFKYGRKTKYFEYGSFAYLAAFSKHAERFPEWFAMAGSIRGVLPYDNVEPSIKFSTSDINDILTTRDGSRRACNPICEVRPYGNIIYGNRTMYSMSSDEITEYGDGLRASHFLNIRQLCCTLKKVIYRAGRRFLFEPNTDVLWVNFCEAIRPTLELMKTAQGIKGYTIRRESTTEKGLVRAVITIKPVEAVEDFDIGIELSDSVEIYE